MLPGTDGIQLMQTVPELADLPVIFISGYGRDETIARALEAGADDYIVKPFSPTELTARIRAAPVPFALGALAIDCDQRRVTVAGRRVELTATEYELLRVLAQDAVRVLTHETLLRRVWAGRPAADPKIVRAYVKRLRDKLADEADRPGPDRQRARGGLPHAPGPATGSAPPRQSLAWVVACRRARPRRRRPRDGPWRRSARRPDAVPLSHPVSSLALSPAGP